MSADPTTDPALDSGPRMDAVQTVEVGQIPIPGRCAACGGGAFDLLTLHTTREQTPPWVDRDGEWRCWLANDGDLVTCPCGARYVCRDLGEGRIDVVKEELP